MAAPAGPKIVHRYSLEFKIQAVGLANLSDIQTQDVAKAKHTGCPGATLSVPDRLARVLERC